MISLELSRDEARLLLRHLDARVRDVDGELIHTDKRALQVELAQELTRLSALRERLALLVAGEEGLPRAG